MKRLGSLFDLYGRARRRDVWLCFTGLAGAYAYLWNGLRDIGPHGEGPPVAAMLHNEIAVIALTLLHVAILAMLIRRLHDRDKSGLWLLGALLPVIGQVWLIWELGFRPGVTGTNRFGPPPRAHTTGLWS